MKRFAIRHTGAMAAFVLAACGGGGSGGGEKQTPITGSALLVEGVVMGAAQSGQGSPLAGASVHLSVDRNGNGRIDASERVTAEADVDGTYRVETKAAKGQTVVVSFEQEGFAPSFKRIAGGGAAQVRLDATLQQMEPLECTGARCATDNNRLSIKGLGEGISGAARVFNPVTETHHFPGGFDDNDGNLLISGVFSAVELRDANGDDLDQLDQDVELRMQIPRDTWPVIVDLQPGNDRVELPMYAFDEAIGTWVRHDKDGWLEDGDGAIVPESALEAIRSGTYEGALVAASEVNHFSYWNLDWPVESHGCIAGTIKTEAGESAEGAVVSATGVSYSGGSGAQITAADGRFAIDVMRSEGADDVDQDGIPGETHRISLRVVHEGRVYNLGEFDTPEEQGGDGENCLELEGLVLGPDKLIEAGLCTITGTVFDDKGALAAGATVMAWDDTLPAEMRLALCGFDQCSFGETVGADGSFSMTVAVMDNLSVWGMLHREAADHDQVRHATVGLPGGCPTRPVELRLVDGWDMYEFTVSLNAGQISWSPNLAINYLFVVGADGTPKWAIYPEEAATFGKSPVSYGEVPASAWQIIPWDGSAPAALASGDTITVMTSTFSQTGVTVFATGEYVVP